MGPHYAKLNYSIIEDARLQPSDKLILLALQRWGGLSHECFPADKTIARATALSSRTVQRSLDRLEDFGFIKEVPDKNPTGRKFLLLWLDDPHYLPPLREKKPRKPRKATGPDAASEKTCDWDEATVKEWASKWTKTLVREGRDESSVYNILMDTFMKKEPSEEQMGWLEEAMSAEIDFDGEEGHAGSTAGDQPLWKPGDTGKPDRYQVARWVHTRIGELLVADMDCDVRMEILEEVSGPEYGDDIWEWTDEAIKQSLGQSLGADSKARQSAPPES